MVRDRLSEPGAGAPATGAARGDGRGRWGGEGHPRRLTGRPLRLEDDRHAGGATVHRTGPPLRRGGNRRHARAGRRDGTAAIRRLRRHSSRASTLPAPFSSDSADDAPLRRDSARCAGHASHAPPGKHRRRPRIRISGLQREGRGIGPASAAGCPRDHDRTAAGALHRPALHRSQGALRRGAGARARATLGSPGGPGLLGRRRRP